MPSKMPATPLRLLSIKPFHPSPSLLPFCFSGWCFFFIFFSSCVLLDTSYAALSKFDMVSSIPLSGSDPPMGSTINTAGTVLYFSQNNGTLNTLIIAMEVSSPFEQTVVYSMSREETSGEVYGMTVNQDDTALYFVTQGGFTAPEGVAYELDLITLSIQVLSTQALFRPRALAFQPDQGLLFVAENYGRVNEGSQRTPGGQVASINLQSREQTRAVDLRYEPVSPTALAWNSARTLLYVYGSSQVYVYSVLNGTKTSLWALYPNTCCELLGGLGHNGLQVSPDGSLLYIFGTTGVNVLNLQTGNTTDVTLPVSGVRSTTGFNQEQTAIWLSVTDTQGLNAFSLLHVANTCMDSQRPDGGNGTKLVPVDCAALGLEQRDTYNDTICDWPGFPPCPASEPTCCTRCPYGFFPDQATNWACIECQAGGASGYVCEAGSWKSGTRCSGYPPTDTQECTPCDDEYACSLGQYMDLEACDGTTTEIPRACLDCGNGGLSYGSFNCGVGQYKGPICTGIDSFDTQFCQTCNNGGTVIGGYSCAVGQYRSGMPCDGSSYTDSQTCKNCSSETRGAYHCPVGFYRTGLECSGTGTEDVQTCAPCTSNGPVGSYICESGLIKTGPACDGLTDVDTQYCEPCPPCPVGMYANHTLLGGPSDTCSCEVCDAGYYCVADTRFVCGASFSFCPANSSLPMAVRDGYYSTGSDTELTRTGEAVCPPGSFCVNGVRFQCPPGSWSAGQESSPACRPCNAGHCLK